MGSTRYELPLASLPEAFFVEELQHTNSDKLEALLEQQPEKKTNATVPFYLRSHVIEEEHTEQIEAYASKTAILKALELRKEFLNSLGD